MRVLAALCLSGLGLLTGLVPAMGIPATATAQDLRATSEQAGPITAETPFDLVTLIQLFPGRPVRSATETTEGEPYPVVHIGPIGGTKEAPPEITVVGNAGMWSREIWSVILRAGSFHGLPFAEFYPNAEPDDCFPGTEENAGTVFCPVSQAANVLLRFSGAWDGPDGALPPTETLWRWGADMMVWRPPATVLADDEIAHRLVGAWSCIAGCQDDGIAFHADSGVQRFDTWRGNTFVIVDGAWSVDGARLRVSCCVGGIEHWAQFWSVRSVEEDRAVLQIADMPVTTVLKRLPKQRARRP